MKLIAQQLHALRQESMDLDEQIAAFAKDSCNSEARITIDPVLLPSPTNGREKLCAFLECRGFAPTSQLHVIVESKVSEWSMCCVIPGGEISTDVQLDTRVTDFPIRVYATGFENQVSAFEAEFEFDVLDFASNKPIQLYPFGATFGSKKELETKVAKILGTQSTSKKYAYSSTIPFQCSNPNIFELILKQKPFTEFYFPSMEGKAIINCCNKTITITADTPQQFFAAKAAIISRISTLVTDEQSKKLNVEWKIDSLKDLNRIVKALESLLFPVTILKFNESGT